MKVSYYRHVTKEQRSRIMMDEKSTSFFTATIITYHLPPMGYRKGRWSQSSLEWDLSYPEQLCDFENFISRLSPCTAVEYRAAERDRRLYQDEETG